MEAQSLDGNSYPVQVYSDISAGAVWNISATTDDSLTPCIPEWVSGDRSSVVRWSNTNTGKSVYHEIELQNPQQNAEIANQAQDGKAYYAMSTVSALPGP